MSDERFVKWAYRYGSLDAATFDTLDEAIASAFYAAEYGYEALESIEVIASDLTRRVIPREECDALMLPLEERENAAYDAQPPLKWRLRLQGPNGKWGTQTCYPDDAKAQAAVREWTALLGAERVHLEPVNGPIGP